MAQIDLGKLKIKFRGNWSAGTTYEVDDLVQYTDSGVTSTYIAVADSTGEVPSTAGTENNSYWRYMARGTDAVSMSWGPTETTDFTASASSGYFVDTTAGAITVTMPASPSHGDEIAIIDQARKFHTNHCIINPNGNNFEGEPDNWEFYSRGTNVYMHFDSSSSSATGWKITSFSSDEMNNKDKAVSPLVGSKRYMVATSDAEEVYLDGDYMVHRFLTSGTFTVHSVGSDSVFGANVRYLIVGGGGSGGTHHAGGGGAGGFRDNAAYDQAVTAQAYTITVGSGAGRRYSNSHGTNGGASSAFGLTSGGGGGGGGHNGRGRDGASAGGSGHSHTHGNATGQGQGTRGGNHESHTHGGGGGASHRGGDQYGHHSAGSGGSGRSSDITGQVRHYAGGGGGGAHQHGNGGGEGLGGGGNGGGGSAADHYGGGGGGTDGSTGQANYGGAGGSGVVVIRYKVK